MTGFRTAGGRCCHAAARPRPLGVRRGLTSGRQALVHAAKSSSGWVYPRRSTPGASTMRSEQVARISGHSASRMPRGYTHLRGSRLESLVADVSGPRCDEHATDHARCDPPPSTRPMLRYSPASARNRCSRVIVVRSAAARNAAARQALRMFAPLSCADRRARSAWSIPASTGAAPVSSARRHSSVRSSSPGRSKRIFAASRRISAGSMLTSRLVVRTVMPPNRSIRCSRKLTSRLA